MNNPFKVGDVIYHNTLGKKVVKVIVADDTVLIGDDGPHGGAVASVITSVSFKPWPAPIHKRPIEDGWWVVASKSVPNTPIIRKQYDGKVYDSDGGYTAHPDFYNFHKFLGKDWK